MPIIRKTATYAAVAVTIGVLIVLASALYLGAWTTGPGQSSSQSQSSPVYGSLVLVQLTDPPTVPAGTTSLNLTYSSIGMLVAEPAQGSQVTTTTVTVSPQGGSATLDLLKLQNISQTVASASLPSGSTIYSVTFGVTGISMDVNGTSYPVTLSTGVSSLTVTLLHGSVLQGTNAALLELNPTVVSTSTGYQMIPTSVGIMRPQSEVSSDGQGVGSQQGLTSQDNNDLNDAQGQVSARIMSLSVSGNVTTMTVQVNNTGGTPVDLVALSLHGNFSAQAACTTATTDHGNSRDQGQGQANGGCGDQGEDGHSQLVFVPVVTATASSSSTSTTSSSTTTSSSSSAVTSSSSTSSSSGCGTGQMTTVYGDGGDHNPQLTLNPGECIDLTFTGAITIGNSPITVTPSTSSGQTYILHVIATNNAETMLSCVLPLTPTSCTPATGGSDN